MESVVMEKQMLLWNRLLVWLFLAVAGVLGAVFAPQALLAQEAEASTAAAAQQPHPPLCRLGVNALHGATNTFDEVDLAPLRVGWYIDYRAVPPEAPPSGVAHAPVIRISRDGASGYVSSPRGTALQQAIADNPGADWIIGNEPDRRAVPGGATDDLLPSVYALAYHDLYHTIKQADPTARIFAGAIVQPTPVRLQYLDLVMRSYYEQFGVGMPVDGWAIHNFILNERSCDHYKDAQICWGADIPPGIDATDGLVVEVDQNDDFDLFVEQIQRFRFWMASRGYGGKPLYVSEYGVLMPERLGFSSDRVNRFMERSLDYLLNTTDQALGDPTDGYRLVQRLAWFSTVPSGEFNGYLYERDQPNAPFRLSPMGENWVAYANALAVETDLYPVQIAFDPPAPLADSGNITFTVKAQIANAGNSQAARSFTVRFYDGDPNQGGAPIGGPQTVSLAGCGDHAQVSVVWPDVAPGDYRVYVWVDPAGAVGETDKSNNLKSASPLFATDQAFLPLLFRTPFMQ